MCVHVQCQCSYTYLCVHVQCQCYKLICAFMFSVNVINLFVCPCPALMSIYVHVCSCPAFDPHAMYHTCEQRIAVVYIILHACNVWTNKLLSPFTRSSNQPTNQPCHHLSFKSWRLKSLYLKVSSSRDSYWECSADLYGLDREIVVRALKLLELQGKVRYVGLAGLMLLHYILVIHRQ